MQKIEILGVKVNNVTMDETIEQIEEFIKSKKPHQICTVNPEFIMAAQKDRGFKDVLNNADLCVPDGAGLWWASRFLSKRISHIANLPRSPRVEAGRQAGRKSQIIQERVTGVDLIWKLAETAEKRGYGLYLLGAGPSVAEQTALVLRTKYPRLKIVGISEGVPQINQARNSILDLDAFEKKLVSQLSHLAPQILFVAYGAPKQDKFIAKYKKELGVPVMMGVGGAFDFISGRIRRAPKWMRILHLEWLFRLILEPNRLNRIITAIIRFPWAVLNDKSRSNDKT